jgi:hypothetical protein
MFFISLYSQLKIQISSQLIKLLAIPLSCQKTTTKWLVMLRYGKNFLLAYKHMRRGEIFSAPCLWANSEFLEMPI